MLDIVAKILAKGPQTNRRVYTQAPFDLCYGFRGRDSRVHHLSPFEMKRYWKLVEIRPPSEPARCGGDAVLTPSGAAKCRRCKDENAAFRLLEDEDYEVLAGNPRAVLTPEGERLRIECSEDKRRFNPEPESHYVVLDDSEKRIALPDRTEMPA